MKPFDLEEALAGKPVQLRDGRKAYILKKLDNPSKLTNALIGYYVDENEQQVASTWCLNGCYIDGEERMSDIIGMWECKPILKECYPQYRIVNYFGVNMHIPEQYEWIAIDKSGALFSYSYDSKPFIKEGDDFWQCDACGTYTRLGTFDLNGFDWKETLQHFPLDEED